MSNETLHLKRAVRQPLSPLGKLTFVALLGSAFAFLIQTFLIGGSIALVILTTILFILTGFVATGTRWAPLLGSMLCLMLIYDSLFVQSYIIHNLQDSANIIPFAVNLSFTLLGLIVIPAGISATVQNYRLKTLRERRAPRWLSPVLCGIAGIFIGAVLVALTPHGSAGTIVSRASVGGSISTVGEPSVHMSANSFLQSSVTVSKGSKLLLVDDDSIPHILANGTWQGSEPKPGIEVGAPVVRNVQVDGKNVEIGPFTKAGTYHLYCTVHEGMALTIIVQ